MEVVSCSCAKCDTFISDFDNAWNKFGKGHYMPILTGNSKSANWTAGLAPSQDARMAALNTVLEDSYLQDLACKGCGEVLGLKCQNAPTGHILKKDQILLRLKKLNVLSRRTGKVAQPSVRKSHELNKEAVNGDGKDGDSADMGQFREWVKEEVEEQKADIDRISASVQRIENDMQSFKDFMTVVRKELTVRPTHSELDNVRVSITESIDRRQGVALSSEDLELMTDSISKIGSRVSEVDSLKLEVQLLKSRIKRFEENDNRDVVTRSEPRPLSVRPLVEQLQRVANSADNNTQLDVPASKRRRISGQDISESPSLNARSASGMSKPSRLSNVHVADRLDDTHELSGITYGESDDDYNDKPRHSGRSRSTSKRDQPLLDGERPKRQYRRRIPSPAQRGFDENGFPLTANGERDRRYKSGKFAGRRPTLGRRPYGSGRTEQRSTSRGEMTKSEEREEQRREEERADGDNTDDYEEEAEALNMNGQVERGRKEGSNGEEGGKSEYPDLEAGEDKRKEALERRERLVRETMEREMGGF